MSLERFLKHRSNSTNPLLNEVLAYIKKRNGKMMRPILVLLMAKLCRQGDLISTLHASFVA